MHLREAHASVRSFAWFFKLEKLHLESLYGRLKHILTFRSDRAVLDVNGQTLAPGRAALLVTLDIIIVPIALDVRDMIDGYYSQQDKDMTTRTPTHAMRLSIFRRVGEKAWQWRAFESQEKGIQVVSVIVINHTIIDAHKCKAIGNICGEQPPHLPLCWQDFFIFSFHSLRGGISISRRLPLADAISGISEEWVRVRELDPLSALHASISIG